MELLFLAVVFAAVILLLALKRPLYEAMLGGIVLTAILYRMPPEAIARQSVAVFRDYTSLSVIISLYLITYLQRMLYARNQMKLALTDLNGLFHNRRINAAGASMFIGLLPSAAATILKRRHCQGCLRRLP